MRVINRGVLAGLLGVASKDKNRYALNGVHVAGGVAEATNGKALVRVELKAEEGEQPSAEAFTGLAGRNGGGDDAVILTKDGVKAALKATGKSEFLGLCLDAAGRVSVAGAGAPDAVTVPTCEGSFPNTEDILSGAVAECEGGPEVTFDAQLMIDVLTAMVKAQKASSQLPAVTLRLPREADLRGNHAFILDSVIDPRVKALVMPCVK